MATRARSKTADPGDLRKVARAHHAPRKFTEKIAMMRQREAQHAAAFAEAMSNVTQMQQKTVGEFGGSMPTLNDFMDGPVKSIDLQLAFKDLSKVKANASKTKPRHMRRNWTSLGSKTTADVDPYPMNLTQYNDSWLRQPSLKGNNQWSFGGGNLVSSSMHKSDSDLHQSLLQEQQASLLPPYMGTQSLEYQQPVPMSNYVCPSVPSAPMGYQPSLSASYNADSSHKLQRRPKLSDPWSLSSSDSAALQQQQALTKKRPSSTSSALTSIEPFVPISNDDNYTLQPLTQSKISSSLPDLTNANFSCGLDRPIDEDRPLENDGYLSNKTQTQYSVGNHNKAYIASSYIPSTDAAAAVSTGSSKTLMSPTFHSIAASSSSNNFHPNVNLSSLSTSFSPTFNSLNIMSSYSGANSFNQLPASTSSTLTSQPFSSAAVSSNGPSAFSSLGKMRPTTEPVTLMLTSDTSNRIAGTLFDSRKPTPPPSYTEHMRQTAVIQHKMASISVCNHDGDMLTRSHSDENLAAQKGLHQNPFMGNMMSASSVPSIYVEPSEQVPFDYGFSLKNTPPDSPSESTTASYASSPPHLRTNFDHPISFPETYSDWPLGGSDKLTERSSLSHHKSLTELSMIAEEPHHQRPPLSHQLSLPSINMENEKPMDQSYNNISAFPMDDNDLEFEADFSVLDNTQLPDLTTSY